MTSPAADVRAAIERYNSLLKATTVKGHLGSTGGNTGGNTGEAIPLDRLRELLRTR